MAAATLTFLFTDIEASTRRWEADAPAMSDALARHDGLLRAAIEGVGGEIFKHTGDGVCATFPTAPAGVAAALAVQRALHAEDWGTAGELRVRMALHSGTAERRENDYFGPALNRVARLMATAHGGQIVASRALAELGRDELPAGAALIDLGEHRLADLAQPEQVFQLTHPDLPAHFPPLRSLETRHNLPRPPTAFVGRERELEELDALLAGARLITLTGAGGAGKTRLALETAVRALVSYPDGVFLVELAPLTDPELVAQAALIALGLVFDRLGSARAAVLVRLSEHLAGRRMLVVLDNCEHLAEPAAELADTLLRCCPGVTVLATSREPLGVPGETLWRVPSLSLPVSGTAGPDELSRSDAVAFLCDRAAAADQSFRLSAGNAAAVAQICRRLDGIPLALELAAARFRLLSPDEVASRLDDRFHLLTAGARTVLDRHRTLRATVDWGYDLLSPSERTVLGRLSVFVGGFDLEAAEAVVPDGGEIAFEDVLDLLGRLVDRSWVATEPGAPASRYRLLETIRQYAAEKLSASGGVDEVRRRHAWHFVRVGTFEPDHPLRPPWWMRRAEANQDNLRAALAWCFETGDVEAFLGMTAGLSRFWGLSGLVLEGRAWLERALEAAPDEGSVGTVGALNGMGFLLFQAGEPAALAATFSERARVMAQAIGDRPGEAVACSLLGFRALQRGEFDEAGPLFDEATEGFTAAGIASGLAWGEWGKGWIASARGDRSGAALCFERVLELVRGDRDCQDVLVHALAALAPLTAGLGDGTRARRFAGEAIEGARDLGVPHVLIMALTRAAETEVRLGATTQAVRYLQESLLFLKGMDGLAWVAYSLELSALLALTRKRHRSAALLFGAAQALDRASDESSKARPLHEEMEGCLAELARILGAEQLAAELGQGAALPLKAAFVLALDAVGPMDPALSS